MFDFDNKQLHYAAQLSADRATIQDLLEQGYNPLDQDIHGNTPLHTALAYGTRLETIQAFLDCPEIGQIINHRNRHGYTPIMIACGGKDSNPEIIELILSRQPDLSFRAQNLYTNEFDGDTAFQIACRFGIPHNIRALLRTKRSDYPRETIQREPINRIINNRKHVGKLESLASRFLGNRFKKKL
jgi:ankyrin repeat protein